jgi:hypothetical protein
VTRYRQSVKRALREHGTRRSAALPSPRPSAAPGCGTSPTQAGARDGGGPPWRSRALSGRQPDLLHERGPRHPRSGRCAGGASACDEQGRIRALIATAPVTEDAPPETPEPTDVPELPPPAERTPADQTLDPPENGIAFTIPVAVLEGYETPDGRFLTAGNGGRRDLPMTLMAMLENPNGGWGHDGAIAVGRVDTLERFDASAEINPLTGDAYGPGVFGWKATGWLTPHPDQEGSEAAVQFIRDQVIRGVSVDLDEFQAHEEILAVDEDGWPTDWRIIVDEWSIGQMTVCPFAAFPGATIVLDEELAEPRARRSPPPGCPPAAVAAAGQPGVLTFRGSGCAPCDAATLTASAAPTGGARGRGRARLPAGGLVLPAAHARPPDGAARLRRPQPRRHPHRPGVGPGRLVGRLPHRGRGRLRDGPPPRGGRVPLIPHPRLVYTAEGEELGVGCSPTAAATPTSTSGSPRPSRTTTPPGRPTCKCRVGEDDDGIWFAGAFRPQITREQVEDFAAFPVSGDWRADAGDRDVRFIAAVSVNTPGFQPPAPHGAGRVRAARHRRRRGRAA